MSKAYRLRAEETEAVREATVKFIVEKKVHIKESDVLHALIQKHLKNLTAADVLKYREETLGKED